MPEALPVITLHQPWASLILAGVKPFETRSWAPPVRLIGKSLGIHAGLTIARRVSTEFAQAVTDVLGPDWGDTVPTGKLLCTVTLCGAWKTGERIGDGTIATAGTRVGSPTLACFPEDLFGDYAAGRWIWGLKDIVPLLIPAPLRGRQRLWSIPADAVTLS